MNSTQPYNFTGSNLQSGIAQAAAQSSGIYGYSGSYTVNQTTTTTSTNPLIFAGLHQIISHSYKFNPEKIKTLDDVIELLSVFNLFDIRFSASDLSKIEQLDFIAAKGLITKS